MNAISLAQAEALFEDKDSLYDELLDDVKFQYKLEVTNTIQLHTYLDLTDHDTGHMEKELRGHAEINPQVKQAAFGLINLAESIDIISFPFFGTVSLNGCVVNVSKIGLPSYEVTLNSGHVVNFSLQEMSIRGVYNTN